MAGGFYRKIDVEEFRRLTALGEETDWAEGVGYIVYDAQAYREGRAAMDRIAEEQRNNAKTRTD